MTLDCFEHKMWHHCIKMEFQKIANNLEITSDDKDLPKLKNRLKFKINQEKIKRSTKKLELKHQC